MTTYQTVLMLDLPDGSRQGALTGSAMKAMTSVGSASMSIDAFGVITAPRQPSPAGGVAGPR
jgi:hypothetical protein